MTRFFYAEPLTAPEHVRRYLRDPELHWRKGFSAAELATSWLSAGGLPRTVREVLKGSEIWRDIEMIEGLFEREVDLRTPGHPSQSDLMVYARLRSGLGVIAVEGKVRETFDRLVAQWNNSTGKARRLAHLCDLLDIRPDRAQDLRWQLFHRAASAVFEAERWGASHAMLMVHSFCVRDSSLDDFLRFADAAGFKEAGRGKVSLAKQVGSVSLSLGWVADQPCP